MKFLEKFDKRKLFKSRVYPLIGILGFIVIAILLYAFLTNKETVPAMKLTSKEVSIKPVSEVISEERLWRQAIQEKLASEEKKLNSTIDSLKEDIDKTDKSSTSHLDKLTSLETKLNVMSDELLKLKSAKEAPIKKEETRDRIKQINQHLLSLENSSASSDYKPIKTSDNYIPAGSFAKAVLLSGVDASTSLNSQSDPDPVLIRITDHGTLPRRFKSDLKDCHIIGSAYGDLSSERAKIRLEKLSCTEITTGEIIETEVAGFVSGEDGRQGMRGTVVSTEGKLLGNSLLSGVLSGLSNNLTTDQPIALFSSNAKPASTADKFKNSLASGASHSLDRLSKYYIDRAESLQPIIQVGAGRKIDVIFTEGVFFGTSSIKKEIAKKRDEKIRDDSRKETLTQRR